MLPGSSANCMHKSVCFGIFLAQEHSTVEQMCEEMYAMSVDLSHPEVQVFTKQTHMQGKVPTRQCHLALAI